MTPRRTTAEALALRRELHERLDHARAAGLPAQDVENAALLVDVGEYGVALENLATQVTELDVVLPPEEREALRELGSRLGVDVAGRLG